METANYSVIEDLELLASKEAATEEQQEVKRRPGRPRKTEASPSPAATEEQQAEEIAELVEKIASKAAASAVEAALNETAKRKTEILDDCEKRISELSKQYAKPQHLCLHVKLNELPPVKLKQRASKLLPLLVAQAKIGQKGGKWPMLIGPTGAGKTVACGQLAEVLKLPFEHICCSEGMSETYVFGRQTPNGFIPGGFWKTFKNGGVFLADEMDACNENVLLALNTALANGHLHNPINGETAERHPDFVFIASCNTNGKGANGAYTGRNRLDMATLKRFSPFQCSYDLDVEKELCQDTELLEKLWSIRLELNNRGSKDVITSRDIKDAYLQLQSGFSMEQILSCLAMQCDASNQDLFETGKKKAGKK